MARTIKGVALEKGSIGDVTVYERNGQTVVRQKHPKASNYRRSVGRLRQVTKLMNVNCSWRAFCGTLKGNFELKKANQTDYNAFQANNMENARVFLTRKDAEDQVTVLDNFIISRGTLEPSIEVTERATMMVSNIDLGGLELEPQYPVDMLTHRIIEYNKGFFRKGDELLFYRATQVMPDGEEEKARIEVRAYLLPLCAMPNRTLQQFFDPYGKGKAEWDGFQTVNGRLACEKRDNSMVAWVHRRPIDDKHYQVSTQQLVGNNALLGKYASQYGLVAAIRSYGPDSSRLGEPNLGPHPIVNPYENSKLGERLMVWGKADNDGHGRVDGGGYYPKGKRLKLEAVPDPGYRFDYWDDGDCNPERTIMALTPRIYLAHFVKIEN